MFTSVRSFTLGCDSTSNFGTKRAAYQAAIDLLHSLGKEMISKEMVHNAFFSAFVNLW